MIASSIKRVDLVAVQPKQLIAASDPSYCGWGSIIHRCDHDNAFVFAELVVVQSTSKEASTSKHKQALSAGIDTSNKGVEWLT